MSKVPEWVGVMDKDGAIFMDNPKAYTAFKRTLRGKRIVVTVRQWRKKATRKQHGWYRGCALPMIAEEMGHLPYEYPAVHDMLMREWFGLKEGKHPKFKIRHSTADMNTVEFTEQMIEMVQVWAATELGVVIPDPDANWKQKKRAAAA